MIDFCSSFFDDFVLEVVAEIRLFYFHFDAAWIIFLFVFFRFVAVSIDTVFVFVLDLGWVDGVPFRTGRGH